ncbi:MAG: outer membrane protein assembly factor BamD [Phycisphaerae bacterium]|nr:outer membrane protein assembly factor BamD [Phycisphaerae bacterium]
MLGPTVLASDSQEEQYRERQVLDPETDEWVARERPPELGPEDELDEARTLLAAGEPRQARKLLKQWLEENPDSERYFEAEYLLGETYFESRDYWKAVERHQTVAENAAGELFHTANERCVDVARAFLSGQKRILWKIFRLPAYDDGIEILDRVWQREPGTQLGELALKLKADYYFTHGDVDLAQDEYANLALQFPSGRYIQLAMLRTAVAAEAGFPGIQFDDRPLIEAAERYRQFQAAFPAYAERENVAERIEGIRQQRGEKDLDIARWYERTRRSDAAQFYYRQILKDWPDTLAATEARARLRALGSRIEEQTATVEAEGGEP